MTELAIPERYPATVVPVRGGRSDVTVHQSVEPRSFGDTDIVRHLREFFAAVDAEAERNSDDPVALVNALARLDVLTADVRAVRDSIKRRAAITLAENRIRKLIVEGVAAVEASSEIKRSEWEHERLLGDLLSGEGLSLLDTSTGERIDGNEAAEVLLTWFRPEWKLTAIRDASLDPDDYCRVATDDEDRPMRTPTLRMGGNLIRRMSTTQEETTT